LPGMRIPKSNRRLGSDGGPNLAVRTEGHAADSGLGQVSKRRHATGQRMPGVDELFETGGGIPELEKCGPAHVGLNAIAQISAEHSQRFSIGGVSESENRAFLPKLGTAKDLSDVRRKPRGYAGQIPPRYPQIVARLDPLAFG